MKIGKRLHIRRKGVGKGRIRRNPVGRKATYKGYYKFEIQYGNLNMTKPEFYEGIEGYGNKPITLAAKKTVVADYYDLPNRVIPITPQERKEILKFFSIKEQREILGRIVR